MFSVNKYNARAKFLRRLTERFFSECLDFLHRFGNSTRPWFLEYCGSCGDPGVFNYAILLLQVTWLTVV